MSDENEFQQFLARQRQKNTAKAEQELEHQRQIEEFQQQRTRLLPQISNSLTRVVNQLQNPDIYELRYFEESGRADPFRLHFAAAPRVPQGMAHTHSQGNGAIQVSVERGQVVVRTTSTYRIKVPEQVVPVGEYTETWLKEALQNAIRSWFNARDIQEAR
jgi:hypothetical protein